MNDRLTAAEYRALMAGGGTTGRRGAATSKSHGSPRGEQGSGVGTCRVCGLHVGAKEPAWFHTEISDAKGTEVRWVEHQACHVRAPA